MSFVGNCGTFTRGYKAMIMDVEFLYHLLYLLICALGLFVHEFFYSLLVGIHFVLRMFCCLCVCKVPSRAYLEVSNSTCFLFCYWKMIVQALLRGRTLEILLGRGYSGRLQDSCHIFSSWFVQTSRDFFLFLSTLYKMCLRVKLVKIAHYSKRVCCCNEGI